MRIGTRARVAILSLVLLIPCFWQRRIEAGDLGSHIYNAWLAQQIGLGKMPGLTIAPVTTNVLFDLLLSGLFRAFGAEPAQRIAVSIAVLIFFWGAFRLITVISGSQPWFLAPCLMMLAYGWVFHMGFFNFYLATGLSLWALALQFERDRPYWGSIALLVVAYAGHAIPPAWAVAVLVYAWAARRVDSRARLVLLASSIGAIVLVKFWLASRFNTFSSFHQVLEASAIDQVWVYGLKYWAVSILLAMLWSFLLLGVTHVKGMAGTIYNVTFHLCVLMGVGILILPTRIELPQYNAALSFITERMTLPYGVLICAFLAKGTPPKWLQVSFAPLALLYFSFLLADSAALNRAELSMEKLTAGISPGDRVIISMDDPLTRTEYWPHMLDRACLGRCLSYANYEPFSKQFRIRTTGPNPFVVAEPGDYAGLKDGGYIVKAQDLPMYQITLCDADRLHLCRKPLQVGKVTAAPKQLSVLPLLW